VTLHIDVRRRGGASERATHAVFSIVRESGSGRKSGTAKSASFTRVLLQGVALVCVTISRR
jgi:hypothetical protein